MRFPPSFLPLFLVSFFLASADVFPLCDHLLTYLSYEGPSSTVLPFFPCPAFLSQPADMLLFLPALLRPYHSPSQPCQWWHSWKRSHSFLNCCSPCNPLLPPFHPHYSTKTTLPVYQFPSHCQTKGFFFFIHPLSAFYMPDARLGAGDLDQGSAYWMFGSPPVFINKTLSNHSHTRSFTHCLHCPLATMAELSSCDKCPLAQKAENICYLAFFRKSWPTPNLDKLGSCPHRSYLQGGKKNILKLMYRKWFIWPFNVLQKKTWLLWEHVTGAWPRPKGNSGSVKHLAALTFKYWKMSGLYSL